MILSESFLLCFPSLLSPFLFLPINFDSLMAKLSPKDIILFLDEFYSLLDQFCQLHGLQKIETVGKTFCLSKSVEESLTFSIIF